MAGASRRCVAALDLLAHVGDVEVGDDAGVGEQRGGRVGVVGVDVDLERGLVADDEHRVAELLQRGDEAALLQAGAGDREVGAVAERRRGVLGMGDPGGAVMLERRRLGAAQRADDPCQQDRQPVAAGVDDARLAQHREQVGAALDRLLAGLQRALDHARRWRCPAPRRWRRRSSRASGHVGELGGHAVGHLAHHGEDRALGRVAHRAVGLVGGAGQRGADQHRVDQLAGPADQLLGGAADELGEDDAAVAARAEQRRAGHGGDDLVAPDLVDRAALGGVGEAVELREHGPQREDHVVAGVAVGDGEHVEVVDLLAARFERGQPRLDQGTEAHDAGIGDPSLIGRSPGCGHRQILSGLW